MPTSQGARRSLQRGIGKRTLCSLLAALSITALVVASYVLSGGTSELFQALASPLSLTYNQASTERPKNVAQSFKPCSLNLTFTTPRLAVSITKERGIRLTGRRIPDVAELEQYEPHVCICLDEKGVVPLLTTTLHNAVYMQENTSLYLQTVSNNPKLMADTDHAVNSTPMVIFTSPNFLNDAHVVWLSWLYSDYLYFAIANKSAEDFNDKVNESLQMFDSCLQGSSLRACAYNTTFSNILPVRLHVGLYAVYLWDWLSLFNLDQFLILRLEDHAVNTTQSMRLVYRFLGLGPLNNEQEVSISNKQASNSRRPEDCSLGPMLPHTRQLLMDFYWPYNQKLAEMLSDRAFLWER
ncbi:carbohydrate sulfotransferase 15 [Pyxicephalus adspersus]|uniref:carbohydrate sulfotransferase 15 n=1 Tax=Pyxicephalus adspersus TaxID=30357 RepID=UPI003B5982B8